MSSPTGRVRSKNGCVTCKKRRKKCDETRPICERCTKAGMECLGYESTDPDSRPTRIRSKTGARVAQGINSRKSASISGPSTIPTSTPVIMSPSESNPDSQSHEFARPCLPPIHNDGLSPPAEDHIQAISSGYSETSNPASNDVFDFSFISPSLSGLPFSHQFGGDPSTWDTNFPQNDWGPWIPGQELVPQVSVQATIQDFSSNQQSNLALYKPSSPPDASGRMTSGQASLLNALFSLGGSTSDRIMPTPSSSYSTPPSTNNSTWPSPDTELDQDQESETSEESDPEGVRQIVCGTPTLEPTVQSNSLPFVLYSYATMATRTIYEPLKMAVQLRDWLTERYNHSDESRTGLTMLANVFHTIWNTRTTAADYIPMAATIAMQLRQRLAQTSSSLGLAVQNQAQKTQTLGYALEVITLQMQTGSLQSMLETVAETAPLFRSTCTEAAHELIDLPAKLTHPDISLRHFVVIDVILSVATVRPMQFRYNTQFDKEFRDRDDVGMQWFNGVPGEFILIMARINMLMCDYWANVDPRIVAEIEQQLRDFKSAPGKSPDAYLMVARLAVQECWRLAVLISLYMCLCSANSKDPRVEKAQRSFMRVLDRTKPNRTPDVFLLVPLMVVGRATYRPREREIIRQRLLNLQECSHPGTCGHDAVRVLDHLWAKCDAEGRPAVWGDARFATLAVCGV
ncbi:unnamed protein product [Rhizoctonia solani]|uniref:Zn(2)-C6 fungal-type domain-containing protein n=1 Tax=Rhizoctonia solani TaxID=456999 RepID=A0A8H3E3W6_9AGAM|nr:unnamed protein product [Rhizoctonia solani]